MFERWRWKVEGIHPPYIEISSTPALASMCVGLTCRSVFQWCVRFDAVCISCSSFSYHDQPKSPSNRFHTFSFELSAQASTDEEGVRKSLFDRTHEKLISCPILSPVLRRGEVGLHPNDMSVSSPKGIMVRARDINALYGLRWSQGFDEDSVKAHMLTTPSESSLEFS